jgi:hypothetical protein
MLLLTDTSGNPCLISADHIIAAVRDKKQTFVYLSPDKEGYFLVRETPEQIADMLGALYDYEDEDEEEAEES